MLWAVWGESYESTTTHVECGGETVVTLFLPSSRETCSFNETKTLHHLHKTFSNFLQFDLEILKWGYLRIYDDDKTRPRFWRDKKKNIFSPHNLHFNLSAGNGGPHFWAAETHHPLILICPCGRTSIVWTFQKERGIFWDVVLRLCSSI